MKVDFNDILAFAVRWLFAGFWIWWGVQLAMFVARFIPGLH